MNLTDEEIIDSLQDLLNDCLESMNQNHSFKVVGIVDGKFRVDFDIVEIPEDSYVGFQGY